MDASVVRASVLRLQRKIVYRHGSRLRTDTVSIFQTHIPGNSIFYIIICVSFSTRNSRVEYFGRRRRSGVMDECICILFRILIEINFFHCHPHIPILVAHKRYRA